jgi:hypothetical protein
MHGALEGALEALAPEPQAGALLTELTRGMFPPETLRLLLREATRAAAPVASGAAAQPAAVDLDLVARGITPVLQKVGPEHLPVAMEVVGHAGHEALRRALFGYLERTLPGHEEGVVDALMTLDLDTARPILGMFAASRTQGAQDALKRLSGCASAALRCEAIAHLASSPEQIRDELLQLAESAPPDVRVAALRTLAHHQVRAAGPLLVRRVQDSSFHQLTIEERREFLGALYTLNPSRGESLAIETLLRHGLLSDDAVETTRCISAELLGREASSQEALDAALAASKRRPWNSQPLRDVATAAAEAIAARLGKRILPTGELQ